MSQMQVWEDYFFRWEFDRCEGEMTYNGRVPGAAGGLTKLANFLARSLQRKPAEGKDKKSSSEKRKKSLTITYSSGNRNVESVKADADAAVAASLSINLRSGEPNIPRGI